MGAVPRSTTRRGFGRLRQFRSGRWKASYTGPDGLLYEAPNTFALKLDAEAWLTDRRREIDRELWSPPDKDDKPRRQRHVTLADYAQRWLETRTVKGRPLRPRTRAHYESLLSKQILPTFGPKPLPSITMEMVDRWYAKMGAGAPTLRAHSYSLLRTVLESARTRDKLIESNPCAIAGGGSADRVVKPKPATLEQLDVLVTEMPDQLRLMVLLASWCALRFGELVELRRGDVDLEDDVVKVRRAAVRVDGGWIVGDPKSDAGKRDVAVPPHLIPAVENHLSEYVAPGQRALLFPAKSGEHLQPSTLYRHFYRAREKAKRPDLRWHDLRHSGAVLAAQTGATLAELMGRLGHSSHQAAMRYQHAAAGRDKAIAAAMSKMVEGVTQ
ncbi:tyrosine-type recombinase/integrase [Mycolicibacterium tusciae]|uniref:Site-specific integrase n=1 Tax=Mycolicibacterium tusciae TaxID=75922 RepID=A0A1X0K1D0_9MYCO|nr:site-specific integrase [Mycolicibacterium tusciae]ORB68949.1 site-specific integrase [Mycolicibacterium tusciae]